MLEGYRDQQESKRSVPKVTVSCARFGYPACSAVGTEAAGKR